MTSKTIEESSIRLPSLRVGIATLFTLACFSASLCGVIFWAFADKHNEDKFIPRSEYSKDQQYLQTTVSEIKKGQDEMQHDIKQILKDNAKK